MSEPTGYAVKYHRGQIDFDTAHSWRLGVIEYWDKQASHPSLLWKNMRRKYKHKIVKVKLVEIK